MRSRTAMRTTFSTPGACTICPPIRENIGKPPRRSPGGGVLRPRGAASEVVGVRRSVRAYCFVGFQPLFRYDGMDRLSRRSRLPRPCLSRSVSPRRPISLSAKTPCTIRIRAGNAAHDDLAVDMPPQRGTLTARGRTGDGRSAASGIQRRGSVWLLAPRPIVSDPRDADVSRAGDRELDRRHRSDLCQVCLAHLDLQRSPSRICREPRAPKFFAL